VALVSAADFDGNIPLSSGEDVAEGVKVNKGANTGRQLSD
jgi:hypothetical protein